MPPTVDVTRPDLTDPSFDLVAGQPIETEWTPGPDEDGDITITASTSITETVFDIGTGTVTFEFNSVTVICDFPDNAGSGTVPAAATSRLQSSAPLGAQFMKNFAALRENVKLVPVSAPNVSGPATIRFVGGSSMSRTVSAGFSFP